MEEWEKRLSYTNGVEAAEGGHGHYDDMGYMEIARRLVSERALLSPYYVEPVLQVHRTPGYPAILAVLGMLSRWNLPVMLVLQIFALSAIPVIFWRIVVRVGWPSWTAWFLVFDPLLNLVSLSFMTEGWLILALLLAVLFWLDGEKPAPRCASFICLGLAVLIKPTPQFFLYVALGLSLAHFPRRLLTLGAFALGMLPILLWMARNLAVGGAFCLSTQSDGAIMVKYLLESKKTGAPMEELMEERSRMEGRKVARMITDDRLDFKGETARYLAENKWLFLKYHALGAIRVLFGTGREHMKQVFWLGKDPPAAFQRGYGVLLIGTYVALYSAILLLFRASFLMEKLTQFSLLFIMYNIGLIGVFAYLVGGGLKRAVFVPFLYLLLAQGLTLKGSGWPLRGLLDRCVKRP